MFVRQNIFNVLFRITKNNNYDSSVNKSAVIMTVVMVATTLAITINDNDNSDKKNF